MSKIAMRIEKAGSQKNMQPMIIKQQHNRREKNAFSVQDKSKSSLNKYYGETNIKKYIEKRLHEMNKALRLQGKRAVRKDANLLFEMIVSADGDFFKKHDAERYFDDTREFVEKYFGKGVIVSDCRHYDETREHQHMLIMPIWEGKFNYNHFFHGRESLSELQGALFSYMNNEKGYDFEERVLASESRKKHKSSIEWSNNVQVNGTIVDSLDPNRQRDLAIQGALAQEKINKLADNIKALSERVDELEDEVIDANRRAYEFEKQYKNLGCGVFNALKGDKKQKLKMIKTLEQQGNAIYLREEQKKQKANVIEEKTIEYEELER